MSLFNGFANLNKRFIYEKERSESSCSQVVNSLIQIIYLDQVSSELNSQVRTGRTCEFMRARNWKVSY